MFSTVCNEYCMFHFMMLRGEVNMQLFKVTVSLFCRDVGILDDYFYFGFLSQLVNCMNKSLILKRCLELTEARPHASWYINTNHGTWQASAATAPVTRLAPIITTGSNFTTDLCLIICVRIIHRYSGRRVVISSDLILRYLLRYKACFRIQYIFILNFVCF